MSKEDYPTRRTLTPEEKTQVEELRIPLELLTYKQLWDKNDVVFDEMSPLISRAAALGCKASVLFDYHFLFLQMRAIHAELKRRGQQTRQWIKEHPEEVAKIKVTG